jgi:hypothetical protein
MVSWTDKKGRVSVFSWAVVIFFGLAVLTLIGLSSYQAHETIEADNGDDSPAPSPPIILSQSAGLSSSASGVSKQDVQSMLDGFGTKILNAIASQLRSPSSSSSSSSSTPTSAKDVTTTTSVYPGCSPANTLSYPSCSLSGAFISADNVCIMTTSGSCVKWNPLVQGCGSSLPSKTVSIVMQTADDLFAGTSDSFATLQVKLSGGDLAVKACLPAFSFTLNADTADANGNTGLGGYFASNGSSYIPPNYAPSSANYSALPLTSTPSGVQLYANFFADGSIRVTGYQGAAIAAGTYNVQPACIVYNARENPRSAPKNVRVSDANCISTVKPVYDLYNTYSLLAYQLNFETTVGNYYEYFPIDYYNGQLYVIGNENCYPGSNSGAPYFQYALLSSYYHLKYSPSSHTPLSRVSYVPTLDATMDPYSITIFAYYNITRPSRVKEVLTNHQEAGIAVSRLNPQKMAFVHDSEQVTQAKGGWQFGFSSDAGRTWDTSSVDISKSAGIPDGLVLMPPGHQNYSYTCGQKPSNGHWHCPPNDGDINIISGWEYVGRTGNFPNSCGDNRMAVDALDQFWQVGLYCVGPYPDDIANTVITMSPDYGVTWYLAANLAMADVTAYSYDYTVVAAGTDGAGGALFCVSLKVDSNLSELLAFGITKPVEINCFHTVVRGQLRQTLRYTIPGTEPGHYGGMDIGLDGTIYYVQQGMQGAIADPFTGQVVSSSFGPYGSTNLYNAPLLFTKCKIINGDFQCNSNVTVIARTDNGYQCPTAQFFRCTWSHPSVVVDKMNNLYVFYVDMARNPLPSANDFINNLVSSNQNTRVLMIKSPDGGVTWSAPQTINDDAPSVHGSGLDSFASPNVHFNLVTKYDPITNSIAVSWIDTRPDPVDQFGTQIYAAIVQL